MDINTTLEQVLDYFEDNIYGDIQYAEAAKFIGVSEFHFHRIFSFLARTTAAEYIRRRKMTLAAFDLQNTDEKIIDIALKYGYDSHSSFTRSFKQIHGNTPQMIRNGDIKMLLYPRLHFSVNVKGDEPIGFRIEKTMPYKLFGKNDIILPVEHKYAKEIIIKYGENIINNGEHDLINETAGFKTGSNHPFHLLQGALFKDESNIMHFMYCWEVPKKGVDESFHILNVPMTTWAVFSYYGKHEESLPKIWTYDHQQ